MSNDEKIKVGVFTPLSDKLFFRDNSIIGEEDLAFSTIARTTIIDAMKFLGYYIDSEKSERKKRQHKTTDVYLPLKLGEIYNWIDKRIGPKRRETLNVKRSYELRNGHGEFNENMRRLNEEFEKERVKFNI